MCANGVKAAAVIPGGHAEAALSDAPVEIFRNRSDQQRIAEGAGARSRDPVHPFTLVFRQNDIHRRQRTDTLMRTYNTLRESSSKGR